MKYIDFSILEDILDSFTEELARELAIPKLELCMEGSFYNIVKSVHAEKILKVFKPYIEILSEIHRMTEW